MSKVLVVDDSKMIRKAIRKILENLRFEVDEAGNGQEALNHLQQHGAPVCMLLDIDMPVMDGLHCLKALRALEPLRSLPVIMCTTHTSLEKIQEAIGYGASEYIMKPFTDDIIKEKLEQVGVTP